MDRQRFSAIAHGELTYWNPIDPAVLAAWLSDLSLNSEARLLDVGCGRGALLLNVVAQHGCHAVGVDPHRGALDHAQSEAKRQSLSERIDWHCSDFSPGDWPPQSFDVIACIGASHGCGSYAETLATLTAMLRPGGQLLIGEGFWAQEPADDYLAFLGGSREELQTHEGHQQLASEHGLNLRRSHKATAQEWDHYEGIYAENIQNFVKSNPNDPDAPAMLERITAWREAYLRWGRETLGFGLSLFSLAQAPTLRE
ncbi:MAG: cyclopropane fatty-acyl-phospholipid synthase-like methyltransferase [Pseudohongiellaceae bacterium]|jgi:cyclopropane fatty-acyl-phospholipid synthase-like methyltransferase